MTRIEATCPACGPVECTAEDFELAICSHTPASYYAFVCPSCDERVQKRARDAAVELLIAEGVTPRFWELPAEALESHDGPPITLDDVIDMHELLEQPDWFQRLMHVDS